MVAEALKQQIGCNILTYVDDIVVFSKSRKTTSRIWPRPSQI
jgi:hypothetical protein